MTDLQALVAGAIAGALMQAPATGLMIDAVIVIDNDGNYEPKIKVTGRESGETVLIVVMTEANLESFNVNPLDLRKPATRLEVVDDDEHVDRDLTIPDRE